MFLNWCGPGEPRELSFVLDFGEPFPEEEPDDPASDVSRQLRFKTTALPLTGDGVAECVRQRVEEGLAYMERLRGAEAVSGLRAREIETEHREMLEPLVAVALYLCAANADIEAADGSGRRPSNPRPRRSKKRGTKVFAAQEVAEWDVGFRVGAALRRVRAEGEAGDGDAGGAGEGDAVERKRPRPHARRAHFRHQAVGSRKEGRRELRWIHMSLINCRAGDELPATIRPVDSTIQAEKEEREAERVEKPGVPGLLSGTNTENGRSR